MDINSSIATDGAPDTAIAENGTDRRGMLRLAAAAAAGATAAVIVGSGAADAAGNGTAVLAGSTDNWANHSTTVIHNNLSSSSNGPGLAGYRTSANTTGVGYSENCGVLGESTLSGESGVLGFGGIGGAGVEGYQYAGAGLRGHSTNGVAVQGIIDGGGTGLAAAFSGGRAQLQLVPGATAGAPTTQAHVLGEMYLDKNGTLFLCTVAGTPGAWQDISTPQIIPPPPTIPTFPTIPPSLNFVTPTRVYDSREAKPSPGTLAAGNNRTISVADGRALSGGEVTAANLVPAGATGIAYNITITRTAGAGYLTVNPGGNTTVTSSAVNWYTDGQDVAAASVVGIDGTRTITVIAGGGGSTHFVVDIVGYYA